MPPLSGIRFLPLARKQLADSPSKATGGGASTPDITALSIKDARKRPADSDLHATVRRGKAPGHMEIYDPDFTRDFSHTIVHPERMRPRPKDPRLYAPSQPRTSQPSSEWSMEANRSQFQSSPCLKSSSRPLPHRGTTAQSSTTRPAVTPPLSGTRQPGLLELQRYDPRYPGLLLQPDSRPISQEQLASEVKSIYAGLTMVETKCIQVDRVQAAALQDEPASNPKLGSDHWQALIALHRTLLHEHHDFFLASQHPSASPALQRLAAKYSMPARMWKHGIHSFLELLRRRLPESIDYMLAFIYLAYQMMALLYETVPAFEDTWIECLGDLGRYRMAIEDDDIRDRETWAAVARSWYSKAADRNPTIGRLYHHLAILARPNALQQLYYYARSLTCVRPLASARDSILTLLDPILGRSNASYSHALPVDTSFIQAHGVLFGKNSAEKFEDAQFAFLGQLDNHIGRVTAKWKEQGVYVAVTNIAGLFDYGNDDSILRQILVFRGNQKHRPTTPTQPEEGSRSPIHAAISKLQALWSNPIGVFLDRLIHGVDIIQKAGTVQHRMFSEGLNPGPRCFSNLCRPSHWQPFSDICCQISPKAFMAITALSRVPGAQAARPHISATGIPVTNTFAGALAWIISCFRDGRTVSALLYWIVYGCWILAALLALGFTASSIAQGHRLRYLGVVALMGGLVFAALVASSVSDVEEMLEHIKTWMPTAIVLVAGALPMVFNRVE
jgi:hypothetical protein